MYDEVVFAAPGTVSRTAAGAGSNPLSVKSNLGNYSTACLVMQVQDSGAGGTSLLVAVQGSLDDGVSWFDIAAFDTSVPADNDATQHLVFLSRSGDIGVQAPAKGLVGAIAARVQRPGVWANKMRLLETVVGTYSPGVTYGVRGFFGE